MCWLKDEAPMNNNWLFFGVCVSVGSIKRRWKEKKSLGLLAISNERGRYDFKWAGEEPRKKNRGEKMHQPKTTAQKWLVIVARWCECSLWLVAHSTIFNFFLLLRQHTIKVLAEYSKIIKIEQKTKKKMWPRFSSFLIIRCDGPLRVACFGCSVLVVKFEWILRRQQN